MLDISASGAKLRWRGRLRAAVGDILEFEMDGVDERQFSIRGRVKWISRLGWRRHEIGIHFEDLSEEAMRELVNIAKVTARW